MQFQSRPTTGITRNNRWRLWMLVVALGLVLSTMRQMSKPETAHRLGQFFSPTQQTPHAPAPDAVSSRSGTQPEVTLLAPRVSEVADEATNSHSQVDLSGVKDKTYFRPEERQAWFSLFDKLQQTDETQQTGQTITEVSYVQLLKQPDYYRGRLVTIHGNVKREEVQQPAGNQLGLDSYHRLWVKPQGGGQWPFVVYCLELPAGFPCGDQLNEPVSITGYFFKNWSYAYDQGLGLAPVVLASQPDWSPPQLQPKAEPIASRSWIVVAAFALVFSSFATWIALRQTRRPIRAPQDLHQLATREIDR